ncbi:hypothetical protein [Actinotalea sp. K2]|uniref:hypothetical protein n=1 Tax=Actinotalea sp. K2 TaxID=2939438 RepID=UPI00201717DC|nr:hypothetical protein [Actinotalea sp. K2]MCL3862091.1 hypothetical protein [Actinotalea sp. K2]
MALRDNTSVLSDGLLVVAEEFGDFQDVRRRIDLLCVDRTGQLVVIEPPLKPGRFNSCSGVSCGGGAVDRRRG